MTALLTTESTLPTLQPGETWDDLFAPALTAFEAEQAEREAAAKRVEEAAERGARAAVEDGQPWLDKAKLSKHLSCSVRWIEKRIAEHPKGSDDPFPCEPIAGRTKFKIADVEAWRQRHPEAVDG